MYRQTILLILFVLPLSHVAAQHAVMVPVRRPSRAPDTLSQLLGNPPSSSVIQTGVTTQPENTAVHRINTGVQTVDAHTMWAFRLRDNAILATPIVRLADIIEPVDPQLAAWPRLQRISVGLLPTDGTPMVIQRDRLTHVITTIEATPRQIDWYGKSEISVQYDPSRAVDSPHIARSNAVSQHNVAASQHAHKQPVGDSRPLAQTSYSRELTSHDDTEPYAPIVLDSVTRDRIRYWIELAIRRELREVEAEYEITIDDRDEALAPLASASGLVSVRLAETANEGHVDLLVTGRHRDGAINATVPLQLKAHPQVIVAAMNLQRGERIGISDVRLAPLPEKQWRDAYASSLESVIGQEVRGTLREGAPISTKDIGPPILVHRGDLLEVRVIGGAITITTNAKAIDEGAMAELIEVETIQPRKRLIAKVVSPGLVEIVTRAPTVKK